MVCFHCGWIGHFDDYYGELVDCTLDGVEHSLCSKNIVVTHPSPMEVGTERVADLGGEEARDHVLWPQLDS